MEMDCHVLRTGHLKGEAGWEYVCRYRMKKVVVFTWKHGEKICEAFKKATYGIFLCNPSKLNSEDSLSTAEERNLFSQAIPAEPSPFFGSVLEVLLDVGVGVTVKERVFFVVLSSSQEYVRHES